MEMLLFLSYGKIKFTLPFIYWQELDGQTVSFLNVILKSVLSPILMRLKNALISLTLLELRLAIVDV